MVIDKNIVCLFFKEHQKDGGGDSIRKSASWVESRFTVMDRISFCDCGPRVLPLFASFSVLQSL